MSGADLAPGTSFGKDFEIVRPLRSGGMGTVYVALQRSTGKLRALKLMLPELVADAGLRRRFEQEARIASLIESNHVVEVVGAGVDENTGVPWLAMELLEGRDLDEEIGAHGPMTLANARCVLKELCHAVAAAHGAGIIHRDLKPENVFLAHARSAQETQLVKVLDFGIAKIAAEATSKHTAALGSPIWMAPEQTERGEVTPAADVWAIGLIAFFLLTGKCFWLSASTDDGTVQQIMREVLFAPIPAASLRARQYDVEQLLPAWFDGWFGQCVSRDRDARFPTAEKAFAAFDRNYSTGGPRETAHAARPPPVPDSTENGAAAPARIVLTPPFDAHSGTAMSSDDASAPSAPTLYAGMDRVVRPSAAPAKDPSYAKAPRASRPALVTLAVVALVASLAGLAIGRGRIESWLEQRRGAHRVNPLPEGLANTRGAAWFERNRSRCNPVEVELTVKQDPPSTEPDGVGFMAACFVLAGRLDRATSALDSLPSGERPTAAWAVFEVVHPIADGGDDASAGPAMRLVLKYWPENYQALYHAGMAEYRTHHPVLAKEHLRHFLAAYDKHDGFTSSAKTVLAELDRGATAAPDCGTPLGVDPEGRKIYAAGCAQ